VAFHSLNYVILLQISRRNYGKRNQEVLNVKKLVEEALSFNFEKKHILLKKTRLT
jgi:hypothetical protein